MWWQFNPFAYFQDGSHLYPQEQRAAHVGYELVDFDDSAIKLYLSWDYESISEVTEVIPDQGGIVKVNVKVILDPKANKRFKDSFICHFTTPRL